MSTGWAVLNSKPTACVQAWFAVHGPLLRGMACQDALWSRVVAADAPAADDTVPGEPANQDSGREHFVQEFTLEDRTKLQSDQTTLNALAVERGRQYFAVCEQVGTFTLYNALSEHNNVYLCRAYLPRMYTRTLSMLQNRQSFC